MFRLFSPICLEMAIRSQGERHTTHTCARTHAWFENWRAAS